MQAATAAGHGEPKQPAASETVKQSRRFEQQAPNKKPKLSAEPRKSAPLHQLARRSLIPRSNAAPQTEPHLNPKPSAGPNKHAANDQLPQRLTIPTSDPQTEAEAIARLSVAPQKHAADRQPARRLSIPRSDTASRTESQTKPEAKSRQVGMYDRPWRKHMKAHSQEQESCVQDNAPPETSSAGVKDKPKAVNAKVFLMHTTLFCHFVAAAVST